MIKLNSSTGRHEILRTNRTHSSPRPAVIEFSSANAFNPQDSWRAQLAAASGGGRRGS